MVERSWYVTALLVALLVVVVAGAWNTFAPDFLPSSAPDEPGEADTGRSLDPMYLTEEDFDFLGQVLRQPDEPGRVSAARVLAVSGNLRGVSMLLDSHREGHDPGGAYCMGALEILRLQKWEVAWRTLLLEIEKRPPLDRACMSELNDRFRLVGGASQAPLMVDDPDPIVRRWVAQALADQEEAGESLLQLAADTDPEVRRAAWIAWSLRDSGPFAEELARLAEAEEDPQARELALEVLP